MSNIYPSKETSGRSNFDLSKSKSSYLGLTTASKTILNCTRSADHSTLRKDNAGNPVLDNFLKTELSGIPVRRREK